MTDKQKLKKVIEMIKDEFENAKKNEYVAHPLSYALYHVWRIINERGW